MLIEDVFASYPNLKVNLSHAGGSFYEHTLRLMAGYRNVYTDLGHRLWDSNMSKDWADTITASIEYLNSLDFLSEEDKRMILYENEKKFLGIEE